MSSSEKVDEAVVKLAMSEAYQTALTSALDAKSVYLKGFMSKDDFAALKGGYDVTQYANARLAHNEKVLAHFGGHTRGHAARLVRKFYATLRAFERSCNRALKQNKKDYKNIKIGEIRLDKKQVALVVRLLNERGSARIARIVQFSGIKTVRKPSASIPYGYWIYVNSSKLLGKLMGWHGATAVQNYVGANVLPRIVNKHTSEPISIAASNNETKTGRVTMTKFYALNDNTIATSFVKYFDTVGGKKSSQSKPIRLGGSDESKNPLIGTNQDKSAIAFFDKSAGKYYVTSSQTTFLSVFRAVFCSAPSAENPLPWTFKKGEIKSGESEFNDSVEATRQLLNNTFKKSSSSRSASSARKKATKTTKRKATGINSPGRSGASGTTVPGANMKKTSTSKVNSSKVNTPVVEEESENESADETASEEEGEEI